MASCRPRASNKSLKPTPPAFGLRGGLGAASESLEREFQLGWPASRSYETPVFACSPGSRLSRDPSHPNACDHQNSSLYSQQRGSAALPAS